MLSIEKLAALSVGNEAIDADHREFVELLSELTNSPNANFPELFQRLYEHTERHFETENQLMQSYAFPAEAEHGGEHRRVLGEFKQFKTRVDKGLVDFGRSFAKERLPQWFELHVMTMDSALAAHIRARQSV